MPDDPRQTAFDPAAAPDERHEAQVELQKAYRPLASALLPPEDLRDVIDFIQTDLHEQSLSKARGAQIVPFPGQRADKQGGMQSVYLDDLQIFASGDYFDKPSPMGFDSLRMMVEQTPILNAIIMTRIRQISRFTRPQESGEGAGFAVRHVDRDHQIQPDEQRSIALLTRFFSNCGWEFDPRARKRLRRDNFTQFVSKIVRDSLTMDSAAIETEMKRDRGKGIDGFYAVDGATIRLCAEDGYQGDDEIFALQVVQGRIRTAYTYDDLIYEPRNPRTDVRLAGYGLSEAELLVRVVTGFLNAMTYNIRGFDENAIPRGLLHLSGNYEANDLVAFRRYWNAMVKGINNAWTLPVMVSKDQESRAAFEKFDVEFNEMYFAKWMTFLTSIACAIYGMSPDEINFEAFSASKSSLSGADTAEKLANSKDSGLRPVMSYLESLFSDYICSAFADKYVFRWAGLDPEDDDKRFEMRKLCLSVNEVRAQEGYDRTEAAWGDAPLNPALISAWQQEQQANQPEDFGQPGDAGEGAKPTPDSAPDGVESKKEEQPDAREGDFGKAFPTIYTVEV